MEVVTPRTRVGLSKKRKHVNDAKPHRVTLDMKNMVDEATYFEV
jgi:hypothetical protein